MQYQKLFANHKFQILLNNKQGHNGYITTIKMTKIHDVPLNQ